MGQSPLFQPEDSLLTDLHFRFGGLLLALRATSAKIDELGKTQWFDPQADRLTNKHRMKELSGALFAYHRFLTHMIVSGTAIAFESFVIDVKAATGMSFDMWDSKHNDLRYIMEVRKASTLHNVTKHNQGTICRDSSTSAKFLVDKCGLPEGARVEYLSLLHNVIEHNQGTIRSLDLEQLIFRVHVCALALIERVCGVRIPVLHQDESEIRRVFEWHYILESISL
jgi:hypothetical protein